MKFDLHCHTQEGSLDGKLPIAEYIRLLQEKGYDGMLVTDHNSYKGYRAYRDKLKEKLHNFVVLKGIEYDTIDAGHILVIMPEQVKLKLLEAVVFLSEFYRILFTDMGAFLVPPIPVVNVI